MRYGCQAPLRAGEDRKTAAVAHLAKARRQYYRDGIPDTLMFITIAMIQKLWNGIRAILKRMREHHIFSFAATGAYFLLMSFIPFILILLVLIRYTSLSETDMMNVLIAVVPNELEKFVSVIVKEVYTKSVAVVPISVVIALWSAAKGFHALSYGLNVIFGIRETKNWFYMRFRSMFYTLILAVGMMAALFLMVFGKGLQNQSFFTMPHVISFILTNRYSISCIVLTLMFVFMYRFLPNRRMELVGQIPGALLVGIAWTGFSWVLSIFYNPTVMNTYGSLTAVILAMIWAYFCLYFFLVGAEINDILAQDTENNIILTMIRDALFAFYTGKERQQQYE